MVDDSAIQAIAQRLRSCDRILFVTGAGLSADSGLPTYRGVGGLYEEADTEEGIPIERALSGQMLHARPEVAWRHIQRIEEACRGARPNRAHEVMVALEADFDVWTLTQNVDGLHAAAGARQLIEIHGNVHGLSCTTCAWQETVPDYRHLAPVPRCPGCQSLVRPDVVLFGEMLDGGLVQVLEREMARGFDAVFSVGTTSVFPYIAMPVLAARRAGALTVEINPGRTEVSAQVNHKLWSGAAETLDALWRAWKAPDPGSESLE